MQLILASTSTYRHDLLKRLSIPFRCEAPHVDETAWKRKITTPDQLAISLARAKAQSLHIRGDSEVVIGSDQVAVIEGEILHKPGSREENIKQLTLLTGKTHQLFTAVCVICGETERNHLDRTSLQMRSLTRKEIETYVDLDEPFDCAGGYKFEECGISLFEEVHSADVTAIQGLPLLSVAKILREFGIPFPQVRTP